MVNYASCEDEKSEDEGEVSTQGTGDQPPKENN